MERPPSFLWYGGSCLSEIVLTVPLVTLDVMSNSPFVLQANTWQIWKENLHVVVNQMSLRAFFPCTPFNCSSVELTFTWNSNNFTWSLIIHSLWQNCDWKVCVATRTFLSEWTKLQNFITSLSFFKVWKSNPGDLQSPQHIKYLELCPSPESHINILNKFHKHLNVHLPKGSK